MEKVSNHMERVSTVGRRVSRTIVRRSSEKLHEHSLPKRADRHWMPHLYLIYIIGFGLLTVGWLLLQDTGFSTLLTLSAGIEFFAFVSLLINVLFRQTTSGISRKMIQLEMLVYAFRLSSTLWLRGYLPADSTGSGLFQLCDICAFICALGILMAFTQFNTETQEEMDREFPMWTVVTFCIVLAIFIHPSLNNFAVFDTFWTVSLYLHVVSILPQLMMIVKVQDEMDALSIHFVAAITVSRILNAFFWFYAFEELSPVGGGWNVAGWAVILALFGQVFIMLDFSYYYIKALVLRSKFYRKDGIFC